MGARWTKETIWTSITGRKGAQKNGLTWVQPWTAASLPSLDWTARVRGWSKKGLTGSRRLYMQMVFSGSERPALEVMACLPDRKS